MKKILQTLVIIMMTIKLTAQVGINTPTPHATLDVKASPTNTSKIDGFIPPNLTGNELKTKDALYGSDQLGTIIYATAAASPVTTKTANVTGPGYYYFNGTVWVKLNPTVPTITADNGLTKTGDNIRLGGNLLQPTTIGTSSINNLKITGLTSASSSDNLVMVAADGTIRQGMIQQQFIPALSTVALKTAITGPYAQFSETNVTFNSVPKINSSLLTYNSGTGIFTIQQAGYYQISIYLLYDNSTNPVNQTNGTAVTRIFKNGTAVGGTTSGHSERTNYIYHNAVTTVYFAAGDQLSVTGSFTQVYRFGSGSNISIVNMGN